MNPSENALPEARMPASLTADLLARRGTARPAMRRPALAVPTPRLPVSEDLGWNDTGEEIAPQQAAPVAPSAPVQPVSYLPIIDQLKALAERIARPARARPSSLAEIVPESGRKSAFTLRLDADRQLYLRILSAMSHRSAQQLMVSALDSLVAENPEVREAAARIKAGKATLADVKRGS